MAQNTMTHQALIDQLQGADTDVLRRVLEHAMQGLIDAEAATQIGAGPHERASTRTTYRNGYRERILDTGSGRLELQIPKLRTGSFFPTLLEPRRRSTARSWQWSRRLTCWASAPARSTTSWPR